MADTRGFLRYPRQGPRRRPPELRLRDFSELYEPFPGSKLRQQASRCMDCGIPFCHEGCPLGNLIPEWNDLVRTGRMEAAAARLGATNNFPELTGRLCPAPCEGSCVLGISSEPVLIKQVELEIAEQAAARGALPPARPRAASGRSVAVVGSGPAGLAAAQQLTRAGHAVVVFERAEAPGGLLRYGIPEFKLEKWVLDRRLAQMVAEGTRFRTGVSVGLAPGAPQDAPAGAAAPSARQVAAAELLESFDVVLAAGGATVPRDLLVPGRELAGVHFAMEYLKPANLACESGGSESAVSAAGKDLVIVGGGDTGADCLGTAHRQGARSVRQLEIMPAPPLERAADNPWPTWPLVLRSSPAHEEGGERLFAVETTELMGDSSGRVRALALRRLDEPAAPPLELPADLVLLALGFAGVERSGIVGELGLGLTARGTVAVDSSFATSTPGVFACGDMARGQSLVVWAIAEGRAAAAAIDRHLLGRDLLPAPVAPGQMALS